MPFQYLFFAFDSFKLAIKQIAFQFN